MFEDDYVFNPYIPKPFFCNGLDKVYRVVDHVPEKRIIKVLDWVKHSQDETKAVWMSADDFKDGEWSGTCYELACDRRDRINAPKFPNAAIIVSPDGQSIYWVNSHDTVRNEYCLRDFVAVDWSTPLITIHADDLAGYQIITREEYEHKISELAIDHLEVGQAYTINNGAICGYVELVLMGIDRQNKVFIFDDGDKQPKVPFGRAGAIRFR